MGTDPSEQGGGGLVLAIFGPTASGKSAVAEALAAGRIPAEVVSADAMQAYQGLPILTNQPERPTRLVGIWPLDHEGSVGEYQRLAHEAIDEVLAADRTPVVAGGTGLYLRAALAELDLPPAPPPGARERWKLLYDEAGAEAAHAVLAERDPEAAALVHPNDRRRIVRALELADAGASLAPGTSRLWTDDTRHPTLVFGLDVPAEALERRIAERTREMVERGVEDEAARALAQPLSTTARKVIGLVEFATLPPEEAAEAVALRTRRYAAYQRKWLRRIPGVVSVRADRPPDAVADEILEVARARQRLPARRAG
jgi:tRNA dimethylallyltransferase